MSLPPPKVLAARLPDSVPAPPPAARHAAVAMALEWASEGPRVLLMRRKCHAGDPWSGQVSLPGGHTEPADEGPFATARREALEELSVDLAAQASPLGQLPPRQAMARGERLDLWITPCVFHVTAPLDPTPGPEAEEAFWLPVAPALRGELDHRFHYKDKKRELILPAWQFEKRVIWGLTYRMLSQLFEHFATQEV